ncbi:heterokaryon incompatibility protein-domain-containing protein [Bisporella sp. PMI_857]|nr:heterokaryon incompatibility protein-domain-containing protein [Bisporella sp. PMI_857]
MGLEWDERVKRRGPDPDLRDIEELPSDVVRYKLHESPSALKRKSQVCDLCSLFHVNLHEQMELRQLHTKGSHLTRARPTIYISVYSIPGHPNYRYPNLKRLFDGKACLLVMGGRDMRTGWHLKFEIFVKTQEASLSQESKIWWFPTDGRFSHPGSEGCLSLAQEWLKSCLTSHRHCAPESGRLHKLPTRLLRIGKHGDQVHLYRAKKNEFGSWVSLSYCWGGKSEFVLNQKMKQNLSNGRPLEEFPATIRDAIIITRGLSVELLWVDALCIYQDSKDDWDLENPKMADTYSKSVLTIIAANSSSVTDGILKQRPEEYDCHLPFGDIGKVHLRPFQYSRYDIDLPSKSQGPWATRGWTMQEELLASRKLVYTSGQISWRCSSCFIGERGRIDVSDNAKEAAKLPPSQNFLNDLSPDYHAWMGSLQHDRLTYDNNVLSVEAHNAIYYTWYQILVNYSARDLSEEYDRLPAIAGLAGSIGSLISDSYAVGLWKRDIICGLLWSDVGARRSHPSQEFSLEYPSWSWMSSNSTIDFTFAASRISHSKVNAISCTELACVDNFTLSYSSGSKFGAVRSGQLTMTARYRVICMDVQDLHARNLEPFDELIRRQLASNVEFAARYTMCGGQTFTVLQMARVSWEAQRAPVTSTQTTYSLQIRSRIYLLVLVPVAHTEAVQSLPGYSPDREFYRRVALIEVSEWTRWYYENGELVPYDNSRHEAEFDTYHSDGICNCVITPTDLRESNWPTKSLTII